MGDMAEDFAAMKEFKRKKKKERLDSNITIFENSGVEFYMQPNYTIELPVGDGRKVLFYPTVNKIQYRHKVTRGNANNALQVRAKVLAGILK